ncbi:MAG: AAA family ATPase [Methylococcales bacterium]
MKFGYGLSDFRALMLEGYYYQDRTAHIPLLENAGKQLIFIRPRRFGKSLLLSMLGYYYDVNYTLEFETLFGSLAIGENPTPSHNQYLIMKWDFSLIKSSGDVDDIEQAIHEHLNDCVKEFAIRYKQILISDIEISANALSSFRSALLAISSLPYKLYLLIDEYDNFANEVLTSRNTEYKALLHGEGLLKTVFKAVKAAASGQGLDRVFITGVSPVVLSDMTSGYNVATSIYLEPKFNELCGFTETELNEILHNLSLDSEQKSHALNLMRTFYNGYRFSTKSETSVYNPTLTLYFLKQLQENGNYPEFMLDENLSMDRNKLVYISKLPHGEEVLIKALSGGDSVVIPQLARRFGVEDMLTAVKDETFMVSLMYYFGILTFSGHAEYGEKILKIPNLVAKSLYVERLQEILLPEYEDKSDIRNVAKTFCMTGNLQPLCDFLENRYFPILSNRDYRWSNELIIKIAFMTLLFNDNIYMMLSEIEADRGYVDLSLIVRPDMRRFHALDLVLEFKYIGLKELGMTGSELKTLSREELADLPLVKLKLNEATIQAKTYTESLSDRYQLDGIRTFSVVALGFERVVWLETN